jgi:uncharacterized protein (TIGR02231 family)
MRYFNQWLLLFIIMMTVNAQAQKPVYTSAKVSAATVYFNAAELTQTANATLPLGTSEIVVKNVAEHIYESTVQIGAPASVTVLSVQFTRNYAGDQLVAQPESAAVRKLRDSITILQGELDRLVTQRNNDQKTLDLLDKNQQVAGQNTGLSVTDLVKLVDYYRAKRNDITANQLTLSARERKIGERMTAINTKISEATAPKDTDAYKGKLVIQVMCDVAGTYPLEINYLTQGASWSPYYDLRADTSSGPISMMYKAQITQNTGIDWKQVKLTLSSGTPNQSSQIPILVAWMLRFGTPYVPYSNVNVMANSIRGQASGVQVEDKSLSEVVVSGYGSTLKKKELGAYTTINDNQMNVSFEIDAPYDILSNGKVHSVRMKEIKLPASYRHYSVPKLEQEAFLMAEVTDYGKYNLLPGEANIIFDGMYIGKTTIIPNQTGDTLNLSMGRDKRVIVKREKVADKSGTKFLSSYKEQTFTYETTVRNNKKEAINLMLKDQYPVSTDQEIEVTLLKDDGAKVNTETGVLTWELKLNQGETKKIRISYKVKYPKNKVIDNL